MHIWDVPRFISVSILSNGWGQMTFDTFHQTKQPGAKYIIINNDYIIGAYWHKFQPIHVNYTSNKPLSISLSIRLIIMSCTWHRFLDLLAQKYAIISHVFLLLMHSMFGQYGHGKSTNLVNLCMRLFYQIMYSFILQRSYNHCSPLWG